MCHCRHSCCWDKMLRCSACQICSLLSGFLLLSDILLSFASYNFITFIPIRKNNSCWQMGSASPQDSCRCVSEQQVCNFWFTCICKKICVCTLLLIPWILFLKGWWKWCGNKISQVQLCCDWRFILFHLTKLYTIFWFIYEYICALKWL